MSTCLECGEQYDAKDGNCPYCSIINIDDDIGDFMYDDTPYSFYAN